MMQTENNLYFKGIIILILVNIVSATTFPLTKNIILSLEPSTLICLRFIIASGFFLIHLRNINLLLLRDGIVLGLLFFFYLSIETIALGTIPANRAVFIVSLSAIIVPLLGLLRGQRVMLKTFIAAALAVIGIGIMFWEGGQMGIGDLLMLIDSFVYAVYLIFLEKVTSNHPTLSLTGVQMLSIGGLGAVWSNSQIFNQLELIDDHWKSILYLALVASAAVIWLQNLAQRWISAHEVALIYTMEPLFATVFSFLILGEQLGTRGIIGAIVVFSALIVSQISVGNELKPELQSI